MIDLDIHGNTKPLEASVQAAINRIRRQPIKITVDDKGATQPLGNMKRGADEFSKSMEAANARIIAFGASMAIINGVSDAFKGMVKNMVEVEKALADINVVMGLSAKNLDKFSDSLFKVAKETGAAFNIAAQAATEYARQGLAVEESLRRTKDALILTRLTGMDSAEAVKSLTAAMNTYGSQIKDTTQLVSKFAAVDVQFAVSAEDFADAIARTGAAAKGAGVDIDELIGFVTAAQQQTARGGKVIGNSLKTIFTRVGRTDTLNQLENLGIAVRDIEGKTLGAKRILTDLANTFDKLSESQKAQIAQTVGGVFQINVLKAVLGDAAKQNGILSTATQIAAGATDEAITKNEQLRETMSAMATETGLAIKQLSAQIGEIMLAPGMEKILNTVKSFAESASGILGDGESTGNKFATGFLKGLGNIITGPGLVVLTTVFVKLFAQAFKFTKDSLNSLVGITTQAQKQKAIQTSLVTLFGQNAALNKEMLRTDISRAEKEKIILGLIQSQVAQARILNEVSKQAASTLYRQGYGPSLSPRRNRAYGHIPNFSERQQAAEGGYAAGNIRAMDMPGQGSVIYNSAEQVKNFAGFKQPAIMPPQSSKAGKNYQKAFGEVHGFDPYAADGFIPNFNKGNTIDARRVATMLIPFEGYGRKVSGGGSGVSPGSKGGKPVFGQKINKNILFNIAGVKKGGYTESALDNQQRVVPQALKELGKVIGTQTVKVANQLQLGPSIEKIPASSADSIIKQFMGPEGGRSGAKGAISGLYGAVFEEALSRRLKTEATDSNYMGGDFDVRMATPELKKLYGPIAPRGDFKISDGRELQASMAAKIAKEIIFRGSRGSAPKNAMAKALTGKESIRLGLRGKSSSPVLLSGGFIPNYANPLADAISRERQAGVPVSQIRVDSHPALVNKGNPIGLGVTNTKDEPNGLRDVFGAKGFVPNYAMPGMITDLFSGLRGNATVEDYNAQMEKSRAEMAKHDAEIKKLTEHKRRYSSISQSAYASERTKTEATRRAAAAENKLTAAKTARAQAETQLTQQSRQRRGAQIRGNAGMTAILGLPMAAAYLQGDGPGQTGSGAAMYNAGGALQGAASTGYMASMIAPFFGPAAPFVVAAGALYGAFDGYTSAMKENTEAIQKQNDERIATQAQSYSQGLQSIIQAGELKTNIGKIPNIKESAKILGLDSEQTAGDALIKSFDVLAKRSGAVPHLDELSHVKGVEKYQEYFQKGGRYMTPAERDAKISARANKGKNKENRDRSIAMSREFDEFAMSAIGASKEQAQEAEKIRNNLIDYFLENEKGNVFSFNFGQRTIADLSKEEYAKVLKGESITRKIRGKSQKFQASDKEVAEEVNPGLKKLKDEYEKQQAERYQGLIVQIDKEKAARTVRKQTFNAEMKIKKEALARSNLYLVETELQKKFLSEKEVAQLKYNKALDEAADNLKSGKIASEAKTRESFAKIAETDSDFRAGLAKSLGIKGEKMGDNATIADITDALALIEIDKLIEAVEKYKATLGDDASEKSNKILIEAITEEHVEANRQLQEGNNLKVKGIELENQRNQILADRNRIIRENSDALQAYNRETEHKEKIREFQSQQRDAAILASGGYETKEMKAQRAVDELPKTVENIRRGYTGQIKQQLGDLGLDQDLQEEYFMQGTNLSDLTEKQTQKELSPIDAQILDNTTRGASILKKGDKATDEELDELKELRKENLELEKSKDKILEKSERHKKLISDTKEKIQQLTKEERDHVKAIEDGAKARLKSIQNMKGDGLKFGLKRGFAEMREQVDFMDYHLGKQIPQKFADGLAGALGEAMNGTKKLDEALQDAALNFLQMIQQAFLQKMAYSIVGGIGGGFNNGGSVKKYSKGGNVPAYVSNGEYVMSRQAVNKYGGAFMHQINTGTGIPKFSGGGAIEKTGIAEKLLEAKAKKQAQLRSAVEENLLSKGVISREADSGPGRPAEAGSALAANFGGSRGFVSGREYQKRAMSAFFYSQSGNVGVQEDAGAMQKILSEEERIRQEAEARRRAKKAKRRKLLTTIGMTILTAGLSSAFSSAAESGALGEGLMMDSWARSSGTSIDGAKALQSMNPGMSFGEAMQRSQPFENDYGGIIFDNTTMGVSRGGKINKYSFGGGALTPLLNPSLTEALREKEEVEKKNNGGWISGKTGIDQIPAMLSDGEYVIKASSARRLGRPMLDQINAGKFNEGGMVGGDEALGSQDSESISGNTNNISITINLEKGQAVESDRQQSGAQEGGKNSDNQEKNSAELAERVKHQVVAVILEEQRPGGLLSKTV